MGSLAIAFKKAGHIVSGSDKGFYPPMSTMLKESEIEILLGYKASHLENREVDFIVVGNAISLDNEEYKYALENKYIIYSYPEVIQKYIVRDTSIVVTGTYGKTTITAMLVKIFKDQGIPISYMIGGQVKDLESVEINDEAKISIIEGDEYPASKWKPISKFFYYNPTHLIVTSPTGSITINAGSTHTNTSTVNLTIVGNDDSSGVSSVMLSENINFTSSSWEPFSTSKPFNLSSGDGSKKIYMKLKDNASNISSIYDDTIILDTIPPTPLKIKKVGEISINSDSGSLGFYYLGKDVVLSGTGDISNTAYFKFGDKIFNTSIDSNGKFSINLDIELLGGVNKIEYYQKEPSGSNSSISSLTLITDCIKNFPDRLQEIYCPTSSNSSSAGSEITITEKSTSSISKTNISDLLLKDNEKITIKIVSSDNKLLINTDVTINDVSYKTNSNGEVVIPKVKGKYTIQYKTSNGEVLGNFVIDQDQSAITVVLSDKTKSPIINNQSVIIIFMIGFVVLVLLIITIYFKRKNKSTNL